MRITSLLAVLTGSLAAVQANPWSEGQSISVWQRPHRTYNSGSMYPAMSAAWKDGSKDGMRLRARQDYGAWLTGQFNTPVTTTSNQPPAAYTTPSLADSLTSPVPTTPPSSVYHRSHYTYQSGISPLLDSVSLGDVSNTGMRLRARQDYGAWLTGQFNTPVTTSSDQPAVAYTILPLSDGSVPTVPASTSSSVYQRSHYTYQSGSPPLPEYTSLGDKSTTGMRLRARQDYGAWLLNQMNTPTSTTDSLPQTMMPLETLSQSTYTTPQPTSINLTLPDTTYTRSHHTYPSGPMVPSSLQTMTTVDGSNGAKRLRARQDYGAWLLSQFTTATTSSSVYTYTLASSPANSGQSTDVTNEPTSSILGAPPTSVYQRTHQTYGSGLPAATNIPN